MKKLLILSLFLLTFNSYAFDISLSYSPVTTALLKASVESGADVSFHKKAGEAMVKLVKGQADMAVVPLFLAVKLKNEGTDISVLNTLFGDMLFILNNTGKVKSIEDLKGNKVYIGKGSGPLNLFPKVLFEKAGVAGDVELVGSTAMQIAQLAATGKAKVLVLREPLVTMVMSKNEYVRKAINFQSEWKRHFGGRFIQAALVARNDFVKENPELIKSFQRKLLTADSWVRENPEESAAFFVKHTSRGKAGIIAESIKNMQPKTEVPDRAEVKSFISLLLEKFGDDVGGRMPNDDFIADAGLY